MLHPIFQREVYTIFIVQIFGLLTLVLFGVYVGLHLDNIGASALVIGVVFASRNLVQIFLRVPFSELSQSVGRKPMIIAGVTCYAFSHLLLYFATHWLMVLLAAILVGIGMSLHWPAVFSYIGDIAGKEYGRINGIIFQGQDLGTLSGTLMASFLLNRNIISLRPLFLIVFVIGLFGTVLTIFILPETLDDEHKKVVDSKFKTGLRSFANTIKNLKNMTRKYPLGLIFLFEFLVTFTEFFLTSFFPLLMVISFGHKDGDVANVIFFSTLITILLKPYFGIIFDKWGYRVPILISLTNCSVLFWVITYTSSFLGLLIVYSIIVSSTFVCFIATTGATNNTVVASERGLAMGILGIYISGGRAFSSVALAPVLGIFEKTTGSRGKGILALFRFTSVLIIFLVILIAIISNRIDKKHSIEKTELVS